MPSSVSLDSGCLEKSLKTLHASGASRWRLSTEKGAVLFSVTITYSPAGQEAMMQPVRTSGAKKLELVYFCPAGTKATNRVSVSSLLISLPCKPGRLSRSSLSGPFSEPTALAPWPFHSSLNCSVTTLPNPPHPAQCQLCSRRNLMLRMIATMRKSLRHWSIEFNLVLSRSRQHGHTHGHLLNAKVGRPQAPAHQRSDRPLILSPRQVCVLCA